MNFQIHQYERLSAEEKELSRKRALLDEMVSKKPTREAIVGMLKDDHLKQIADNLAYSGRGGADAARGGADDDDDVPDLVENFEQASLD